MGNSNSNANTNHEAPKANSPPSYGGKSAAQFKEELDCKLLGIENSLAQDTSKANLVVQFANIIELEGTDKLACVNKIVNSMGDEWRNLMKDEHQLTKLVGKSEMKNLKDIRGRYFYLLLETKTVIVGLLEKSKIQKQNVTDALDVVRKAMANDEACLSKSDRMVYDESIKYLLHWIDQSGLVKITDEWKALCEELEAQKSVFEKKFDQFKKKSKWIKISVCLGTVIALAALITLIVLTAGGGAVIAAGVGKTVTVFGIPMVTSHLITAGIAIGASSFMVGGALAYGYYIKPAAMAEKIQQITDMLQQYIKNGQAIAKSVSDIHNCETKIKERTDFNFEVCRKIEPGLVKIGEYLDEYVGQGYKLVEAIDTACYEFIQR